MIDAWASVGVGWTVKHLLYILISNIAGVNFTLEFNLMEEKTHCTSQVLISMYRLIHLLLKIIIVIITAFIGIKKMTMIMTIMTMNIIVNKTNNNQRILSVTTAASTNYIIILYIDCTALFVVKMSCHSSFTWNVTETYDTEMKQL